MGNTCYMFSTPVLNMAQELKDIREDIEHYKGFASEEQMMQMVDQYDLKKKSFVSLLEKQYPNFFSDVKTYEKISL